MQGTERAGGGTTALIVKDQQGVIGGSGGVMVCSLKALKGRYESEKKSTAKGILSFSAAVSWFSQVV